MNYRCRIARTFDFDDIEATNAQKASDEFMENLQESYKCGNLTIICSLVNQCGYGGDCLPDCKSEEGEVCKKEINTGNS